MSLASRLYEVARSLESARHAAQGGDPRAAELRQIAMEVGDLEFNCAKKGVRLKQAQRVMDDHDR